MFAFKLSAKCNTIEELVAVLDRVRKMTGAGCKFSSRNDHGAAAFGFEITYDDQTESWVTYDELAKTVALEFDRINAPTRQAP